MAKKRGLGRSFDSLLPVELINDSLDPTSEVDGQVSSLLEVDVNALSPDRNQPRKAFDEFALEELAISVKEHGVLQPLVVVAEGEGRYTIVAGERRWRASKKAGLKTVPVIVRSLSDQHRLEISLIENLQRKDLNPLETATAYLKLRDQFNMKLEEIAQRVGGRSIAAVSNSLRLLRLPEKARKALVDEKISEGHARQVLALSDAQAQETLLNNVIAKGWSVRQAEQFVIGYKRGDAGSKKSLAVRSIMTENETTKNIAKKLGVRVRVKTTAKGGQLVIDFKDEKDLEHISELLSK